jgi:hypothetical protein
MLKLEITVGEYLNCLFNKIYLLPPMSKDRRIHYPKPPKKRIYEGATYEDRGFDVDG